MTSTLIKAGAGAAAIISIVGAAAIVGVPIPATEDDIVEHRVAAERAITQVVGLLMPEAAAAVRDEWWKLNREVNARVKELEDDPNATEEDWRNIDRTRARIETLENRYQKMDYINENGVSIDGLKE